MTKRAVFLGALILTAALAAPPVPRAAERAGDAPPDDEMTTYYMGLIYRGERWTPERTDETAEIQRLHLANIERLARTGEMLLAGPFLDDGDLRGVFVFQVDSLERAKELVATDPAVKAGRLRVELHPWYAVKGITYPNRPAAK